LSRPVGLRVLDPDQLAAWSCWVRWRAVALLGQELELSVAREAILAGFNHLLSGVALPEVAALLATEPGRDGERVPLDKIRTHVRAARRTTGGEEAGGAKRRSAR
jgi:hypothetical protein